MTAPFQKAAPPYGFLLVLAVAAALYVAMLVNAASIQAGGGEAVIGAAFESMFILLGMWIALAILLLIGGLMGEMPGRAALAALALTPMSGVAAFVAIDMCSRHMRWAIVFPALLAALIAYYAAWARMPGLRAKAPGVTGLVWGAVFGLSVAAFVAATF
jgi:hypothetical protein